MADEAAPAAAVAVRDLLAEMWDGEADTLLARIGLVSGAACADLGCGGAGILRSLSRRAGPTGRVVGIERDPALAGAARRFAATHELANVAVVEGDALRTGLPRASFDLVHARFLLAVADRVDSLLQEMVALARPGGVIAVQEPVADTWRCHPPRPAWDRLIEVIGAAVRRDGGDLTVGLGTYRRLRRAGLVDVRVRTVVQALQDGHPAMRLPILLATALRPRILADGLVGEDELDDALRECEASALDPETFVTSFLVTQVWGRRPGA
jgi:SAM-dependent methyltransferase